MPLAPRPEQIRELQSLPLDEPISMLNLLRFKADGGRARYEDYMRQVRPLLVDIGATLVFLGDVGSLVIAPEEERWDMVVTVAYPSVGVFLRFGQSPAMQPLAPLRAGALEDSRLIAVRSPERRG